MTADRARIARRVRRTLEETQGVIDTPEARERRARIAEGVAWLESQRIAAAVARIRAKHAKRRRG